MPNLLNTVQIHHPCHGWGRVTSARVPLMHRLYGNGPELLLLIRWDKGSGPGAIDPGSDSRIVFENVRGLADMVRDATTAGPPMLPDPAAIA